MKRFVSVVSTFALALGLTACKSSEKCEEAKSCENDEAVAASSDDECEIPAASGHWEETEITAKRKGYFTTEYEVKREPGYFKTEEVTVCVSPEREVEIDVPGQYRCIEDCEGKQHNIMIVCPSKQKVKLPAKFEKRTEQVWVEGKCIRVPKQVWHEGAEETRTERIFVPPQD